MSDINRRSSYFTVASVMLVIAALVYIGRFVVVNLESLPRGGSLLTVDVLLHSLLLVLVGHSWNGWLWWYSLCKLNTPAEVAEAYRSWTVSRLARYIPGKVFSYFVRVGLHQRRHRKGVVVATVVEIIGSVLATLVIGVVALLYYGDALFKGMLSWFLLSFFVCLLIAPLLIRAGAPLISWIDKTLGFKVGSINLVTVLKLALLQLPLFFIHGAAFFLLLEGVLEISWYWFLYVVTVYYLAGLLGQLAFVAPAGLGVREASLLALLAPIAGEQIELFYSVVVIRLILICSEIIHAFLAVCMCQFKRGAKAGEG